jgi:Tfp pilus assembly protein FimT
MKLSQTIARTSAKKNVRGQGMSEYLIIVALIAVAGIAVMGLFGGTARNQVAGLANELAGGVKGDTETLLTQANTQANNAQTDASAAVTLGSYSGSREVIQTGTARTDQGQ